MHDARLATVLPLEGGVERQHLRLREAEVEVHAAVVAVVDDDDTDDEGRDEYALCERVSARAYECTYAARTLVASCTS